MKKIISTTTEEVPGKKIKEILGIVRGNTVRAKNIGRDIMASFKNIVGGEIKSYSDLLAQSRDEAYNRMMNEAISMNADAVVGVRFVTSMIMQGASEISCFGTAVKF